MLRRKLSDTPVEGHPQIQIPLGVDGNALAPTARPRRKKKKTRGFCWSCLVHFRVVDDGRKKIESGLATKRGRKNGVCEDCNFCLCVTGLICFLVLALGLSNTLLGGVDRRNASIFVRPTTSFPDDLILSIAEMRRSEDDEELPILLDHIMEHQKNRGDTRTFNFHHPDRLHSKEWKEMQYVDFGNIDLKLLENDDQKRQIYRMVQDLQGDARSLNQERDDDYENYYWGFDDDKERNPYTLYNEYNDSMEGRCRRVSWHRYNLQTCNPMHELDLVTNTPRFVGDGAYREVFVTEQPYMGTIEEMIFKELRWDLEHEADSYEYVRMDAFVTERFTSNQHIVDIFGFCGLSMLTEFFPYGDIEKDVVGFPHHRKDFNPLKDEELTPRNNFTGSEKLRLALAMVEPVAALHNYKDGVIVHDDIQLCQYLWTDEEGTNVKLNDFNRAEIMLWDEQAQRYCKYKNGRGHGDWRAPEEYKDLPLDEKIDIWSLGNNMYSLLTGVYPFFNVEKDKQIQQLVKDGKQAVIDPRYLDGSYFAEEKLVEVIKRCFVYDPNLRADINEIFQMLKDAIAENEKWEKVEAQRLAEEKERADRKEKKAQAKAEAEPKETETQEKAAAEPKEKEAQERTGADEEKAQEQAGAEQKVEEDAQERAEAKHKEKEAGQIKRMKEEDS